VIYLDSSVALAHLFGEDRAPPPGLWNGELVSSRLLEYELWVRVHARHLTAADGEAVQTLLGIVNLLELAPPVLTRALQPFPLALRTLDALHVASIEFLRRSGQKVELATYDVRMLAAAKALAIPLAEM
jgi:hypothetical protein